MDSQGWSAKELAQAIIEHAAATKLSVENVAKAVADGSLILVLGPEGELFFVYSSLNGL